MSKVIDVHRLTKAYHNVTAINDVSFSVEENKIYGLLGRNGAGKTTLMQLITAQSFLTSGDLKVFGASPYENQRVLRQICFVKESQKYPQTFHVTDVLELSATIFPNWDADYANALIENFQLPRKQTMSKLSRGMLSSVGIIVGLASRAPLTIFDEPYLGLDAVARGMFYDHLIEDYVEYPRTIILSSHLIDEVSRLLEHVIVLDNGKILIDEEADELRGRAFNLVGPTTKIEPLLADKHVIHREAIGSLVSATVMGQLDSNSRQQAEERGLEITPVSLQQLIIHLTKGNSARKAVHL